MHRFSFALCALAALYGPRTARAQLVFGSTTPTTSNPAAVYLDVTSGQTTRLWNSAAQKKVNGMTTDGVGRLYTNDAARLNFWNYGTVGTVPTFIAGMYRFRSDTSVEEATGFDGLAWANGSLYGFTSFPSSNFKRGIYQIPLTPNGANHLVTTPVWLDPNPTSTYALGGLEFNVADGLFYGTNTSDNTGAGGTVTPGLYSIDAFGSGAVLKVASFPAGRTGIDGLAIGGGKFWLTEQDPLAQQIHIYPYDLGSNTYGSTINFALADTTSRASAATWAPNAIPEPSLAVLTLMLAPMIRRARR